MNRLTRLAVLAAVLAVAATAQTCRADFTLKLDTHINGDTPDGFLTATFQTITAGSGTTVGEVALTLSTANLVTGEYVPLWGFNVDPSFPGFPGSLTVARYAGAAGGTAPAGALVSTTLGFDSTNLGSQVKAGLFDIGFTFANPNASRFKFADTIVMKITGLNVTAESFLFKSSNDGAIPGGWYSAADVRGQPSPRASGSIGTKAVPEPSSLALLGCAGVLVGGAVVRRRRRMVPVV